MNTVTKTTPSNIGEPLCLQGLLNFEKWHEVLEYTGTDISLANVSEIDTAGLGMLLNLLHGGKTIAQCNLKIREDLRVSGICKLCGSCCN